MRIRAFSTLLAVTTGMIAIPASAVTNFTTTFDSYTVDAGAFGGTGGGGWDVVPSVEGWTATGGAGIEIQNHVAGSPHQGPNHIELDSHNNSTMSRVIDSGNYTLSFYYSARPGIAAASNYIDVLLNGTSIYSVTDTGVGQGDTVWTPKYVKFSANNGDILSFAAGGTNDSLGGYVDTISLSGAVPEPAAWAMMISGFGLVGAAMRRRTRTLATA